MITALILLFASWVSAAPQVYRDHVEPHWLAGHTRFWYRNDLPNDAREFVLVDIASGKRESAFDHNHAATILGQLLNQKIAPDHLPIESLDFDTDPAAVFLKGDGKTWRLDLKTSEIRPATSGPTANNSLPAYRTIHPSRDTKDDATITFKNQTTGDIDIFWIDTDGQRQHFATVKPAGEWGAQTYAGHVWLVTDTAGKTLGVFDAVNHPATAIIDGKPPMDRPRSGRPRPARGANRRVTPAGPVSPDGKWIAFTKDENLYIRPKSGGQEFQLSHDGKAGDDYEANRLWWSPDSKNLVAMRVEAGQEHKIYTVESSPKDQVQPKLRTLDYLKPGDRIDHPRVALFDVATHTQIAIKDDLMPNPWSIEDVRWSADSSRFTFIYNQRGHQVLRVISVDAKTGIARPIVDEHSDTFIDYSGKYFCQFIGDDELIWMSERSGWNHLFLYDAKTGEVKNQITKGDWVVQDVTHVDEDKRQIWFKAGGVHPGQDPYYTQFCRVNFDGTGFTILTEGDGQHSIDWKPGDAVFFDTWSRVDQPPITELRRSDTGSLVCRLETADASEFLAERGKWLEPFTAKGRDGTTDIYGVILYPRNFDPAKKYPVVEYIYAGPQDFYTPKGFRTRFEPAESIADLGMIVVQCDGMGTSGRSRKFHDVCWKNLHDAGFPDRIAWIKAAAKVVPQMDLTRVGIFGGSAGGQNAMAALIWHNDFYKVAFADCGCHDNRMDKIWWNEQWMGWPVDQSYADNSNVVNAHLMQGKLMLCVGELDDNVDPSSTMQVVNALEKANKDFELVVVTGAHHGAAETKFGSKKRAEFLAKNLLSP
jgi:dipeptidyl aminopeptidase/acylaminoacyl peptidase